MRILLVHNRYRQPGGEDSVVEAESALLEERGHEVVRFTADNAVLDEWPAAVAAVRTVWNRSAGATLDRLIRDRRPDVVHFHNTFAVVSPAAYYFVKARGLPVVQTLHNYRLLCLNAILFRDAQRCEACADRAIPWPGVWHGCYHGRRRESAVVAAMLVVHRLLRTWRRKVDCFVVPSLSAARRFARGGVPEPKIRVKPAFVHPDPGPCSARGGYALFLGRLSEEKGVRTLLRAWRSTTIPLRIAGAGPLESEVRKTLADGGLRGGEWVGWCDRTRAIALLKGARFLVVPSECDETFGMSVVEAFACGVPVISSRRGALPEINRDGITGLLFDAGEAEDLRAKLEWAWSRPETMDCMGSAARAEFEAKYTGPRNGEMLMDIYRGVVLPTTEGNKP